jgi:hypothetical protein
MEESKVGSPLLRIPNAWYKSGVDVEPLEVIAGSLIASHMLWPDDARNRSLYMALCLRKVHDLLLETGKEDQQNALFTHIVKTYFGGWSQYSQNLAQVKFPSSGKGSMQEQAWQGELTGRIFLQALGCNEAGMKPMSVKQAAADVLKALRDPSIVKETHDLLKPSVDTFMKHYWSRFRSVAHFWASMRYFTMPEIEDSVIRLDKAKPLPELQGSLKTGWRGIVDFAHFYLEKAETVKRYKTHKSLLDRDQALRVCFD